MGGDAAWVRDMLVPMLFKEARVSSLVEDDNWVLRLTTTDAELMRLSAPECLEAARSLGTWFDFWKRVQAIIGELHDAR